MTLRDDVERVLPELRREAEARMTSTATVRRKSGTTTPDANGYDVDGWLDVVTDSPFRLRGPRTGGGSYYTARIGETEVQLAVREAHFPADTVGLLDGDLIEVTAGENAGAVLRIVEASWQDQATARRVPVVEASRPEEWS